MTEKKEKSAKVRNKWLSVRWKIVISACIIFGLIILLSAFIGMIEQSGIGEYNQIILDWMSTHRDPMINNIMQIATTTASPTFFVIAVSTGSFLWAYKKREIWRPFLMAITMAITAGLSSAIKSLTMNERPPIIDMVPPLEMDFSFPSGHTLSTFVLLMVTGYLFYSRYRDKDKYFWLVVWIIATISGTTIIAVSRLYLGYHWLTDVAGSVGLGLILFAIVIIVDKFVTRRKKKSKIIL